ncbi:hypothetical protein Tco_1204954 [Tanacetum coccineum]
MASGFCTFLRSSSANCGFAVSIGGVLLISLINPSLDVFWSHVVRRLMDVQRSIVLAGRRCHALSRSQKTKYELSPAALGVLTTQPAYYSSLVLCLSSRGESLPSVPGAYGQTLEALLSQPAASENESHIPAVAVSGVPGDGSRVHTHDYDGSEAPDESPDSTLSSEPKPLGKHRPPHPPSILSPRELSYPP